MFSADEFFSDKPPFVKGKLTPEYQTYLLKGGFSRIFSVNAKTQKARGIFFLQDKAGQVQGEFSWKVPKHLLFPSGFQFADHSFNFPVFARPCPTVPRHGFVDSTICRNAEELNALSSTTFKVEPEAEILITKPVSCSYNAIINGSVITFAPGNDGATAGKGCRYFYISEDPLSKHLDPKFLLKGEESKLILDGEVPFYELVFSEEGETKLVQVRSAPGTPPVKDFVPHKVEVKKIIKAEGDLLEWEELLKKVDSSTTIVDHQGGSLSSHYAIHAIINKVPIFTTYLPELNSVVEPTVDSPDLTDADKEKFRRAFTAGFNSTNYVKKNLRFLGKGSKNARPVLLGIMELALATLHNFSVLSLHKDYETLGLVLGLFVRSTFAVSSGEARHCKDKKTFKEFFDVCSTDREVCYDTMFAHTAQKCIKDIETIFYIFRDLSWGGGGFGGPKWANCTKSSIQLFNAGVLGNITNVVELFNRVINEEHNGGKYLNKIISVGDFDIAAEKPSFYSLKKLPQIVDLLYTVGEYYQKQKAEWEPTLEFFKEIKLLPKVKALEIDGCTCEQCHPELHTELKIETVMLNPKDNVWDGLTIKLSENNQKSVELSLKMEDAFEFDKAVDGITEPVALTSVPYYWSWKDEPVISKGAMTQLARNALSKKKHDEAQKLKKVKAATSSIKKGEVAKLHLYTNDCGSHYTTAKVNYGMLGHEAVLKLPEPIEVQSSTIPLTLSKYHVMTSGNGWWLDDKGNKIVSKTQIHKIYQSFLAGEAYLITSYPEVYNNPYQQESGKSEFQKLKVQPDHFSNKYPAAITVVLEEKLPYSPKATTLVPVNGWWCLSSDGTKVISKNKLSKLVNEAKTTGKSKIYVSKKAEEKFKTSDPYAKYFTEQILTTSTTIGKVVNWSPTIMDSNNASNLNTFQSQLATLKETFQKLEDQLFLKKLDEVVLDQMSEIATPILPPVKQK